MPAKPRVEQTAKDFILSYGLDRKISCYEIIRQGKAKGFHLTLQYVYNCRSEERKRLQHGRLDGPGIAKRSAAAAERELRKLVVALGASKALDIVADTMRRAGGAT